MARASAAMTASDGAPAQANAPAPATDAELDERLSRPPAFVVEALAGLPGDLLVLGAGGKMGLSLATMARRAFDAAGGASRRVIAVSRFGSAGATAPFTAAGVETIASDLLADGALEALPDAANVLFLAGMKFGSTGDLPATWAMNTFLPGLVARRSAGSRIVALSTGNVYPLVPVHSGGAREEDEVGPVGEYAISCLGRERLFTYESVRRGTATALIRLNYANALRYGVLTDIGRRVLAQEPVDVGMGHVNVIWQGDSSAQTLAAFAHAATPPLVLNVTGPETVDVRDVATRLAALMNARPPAFRGEEAPTALLSNASRAWSMFGPPTVPLHTLLEWVAAWLVGGGRLLDKPTGFEKRDGRF
jgi:nucleoside-diphosphate-sugar epimerase